MFSIFLLNKTQESLSKSLSENWLKLLADAETDPRADVGLQMGLIKTIVKAHRLGAFPVHSASSLSDLLYCVVLMTRCDFFKTCLSPPWNTQEPTVVALCNISPEAMKIVLTFLYGGFLELVSMLQHEHLPVL